MREKLEKLWAQAKVVAKAAPTWLTAIAVVLTVSAEEIGAVLPEGAAEVFGEYVVRVVAWIGAAVAIIRRVTPVPPSDRGILPPPIDPWRDEAIVDG